MRLSPLIPLFLILSAGCTAPVAPPLPGVLSNDRDSLLPRLPIDASANYTVHFSSGHNGSMAYHFQLKGDRLVSWVNFTSERRGDSSTGWPQAKAVYDLTHGRIIQVGAPDDSYVEYEDETDALMPTMRTLHDDSSFSAFSAAMPFGPQLFLNERLTKWGAVTFESEHSNAGYIIRATGPCSTGCFGTASKQFWNLTMVLQGDTVLPQTMSFGHNTTGLHVDFVRDSYVANPETIPLPTPTFLPDLEPNAQLTRCEGIPCEGAGLPTYVRYQKAFEAIQSDPSWKQWSPGRAILPHIISTGRSNGTFTVLGQVTTPDSQAVWTFEFLSTDGQQAVFTLSSPNVVQGADYPVVTFSKISEIPKGDWVPNEGWTAETLTADSVFHAIRPFLHTFPGGDLYLQFYATDPIYRPSLAHRYQFFLTGTDTTGVPYHTVVGSATTGRLLASFQGTNVYVIS